MRRQIQTKGFEFKAISPVESPVSVVGKSACGQVDRPLELDLNPRQKMLNVDTDFLSNLSKPNA
jgi:hypothetical protein